MTTSSWRLPLARRHRRSGSGHGRCARRRRGPMGIVDLLNLPRLADPQLSPDGREVALHARRSRLEERPPHLAHLARAGRRRPAGAADQRRRRRERTALVARRQDDRVHREARRQRVRADLSAAGRRRRSAPADDARERGVGPDVGARRHRRSTSRRPKPKTADEKAREKARDDVYAYDENYKQTHLWKVAVASKARDARSPTATSRSTDYDLSADGRKIALPARADAAARRRRPERSVGRRTPTAATPCR